MGVEGLGVPVDQSVASQKLRKQGAFRHHICLGIVRHCECCTTGFGRRGIENSWVVGRLATAALSACRHSTLHA
jgi:hypothetical protein